MRRRRRRKRKYLWAKQWLNGRQDKEGNVGLRGWIIG